MGLPSRSTPDGFTIVELMVVAAIFTILASFGFSVGLDFYKSYLLYDERDTLVGLVARARAQSLSNVNQTDHGVAVRPSSYVLFQGASYATRDSSADEVVPASATIDRHGLSEISFGQISGSATAAGAITLGDGTRTATIAINHEGGIDW